MFFSYFFFFSRPPIKRTCSPLLNGIKMRIINLNKRGVSTVIGFLVMFSAVASVAGYVLASQGQLAQRRAEGMMDVMEKGRERQGQLISLSHSDRDENNDELHVYLANYGWKDVVIENHPEDSDLKAAWVNGEPVRKIDFAIEDPLTDENRGGDVIPKRKFVVVGVRNLGDYADPDADNYSFTLLSRTDIVLSWEVRP